ncbi:EndoU domain-containing protein [Fusobacterium sp.]|uniref:EndoU domain-containing protein n=1 Tax=Fusobacterium sp. TaxID=68766 RepID=UPI0025BFA89D|nr:EndoU domain-containing protein [Fusobacterium sp.]MCI7223112.1 EndoU domain-containing protein [Fusobacterium sp.]
MLDVDKVNIDSNVDKVDTESRSKSKGFLSSKSKVEMQHNETNVAGTLYVEDKATINGDVNVVGSNLVLGKDSYVDGSLTTDSKATYNKYILEEKKKGFSFDLSSSSFNLSYGKNQFNYDEKDKTNIKSNLVLGDGTVLNKGAEITATNFSHGDIEVNNGDVVYGARKDERDVKISTKSSSFGISANVSSPALERIKQGANALEQIGNGDALGGLVNIGNAITGTVEGLAGNQGTKQNANSGDARTKDEINNAKANNNFYVGASINAGYSKSKQETKSHNEKAVVTNITGLDENAKITYNDNKNVKYQGTQASDTTFVYNNVENITKEAIKLENEYSSKGSTFGVGVGASISLSPSMNQGAQGGNSAYGANSASVAVNASASVNKLNSEQTIYENGRFTNVNEVHNNTGTMKLSGFNQEGGTVTGTIKNLEVESKQNTSKTDGYTAGGNISVGITNAGAVSGNVHGSLTDGDRAFVDNQSTFVVGENSNLKIGNVDNTASIIGTTDNGKMSIENYVGRNLENSDKLTTVGGSVGTSGVGINYSNSEKEGITRNTVVGNVEIEKASGDTINRDLEKANEITKDSSTSTNVYAESQLVNAVQNPNEFKEKTSLANQELKDLKNTVLNTIENKGKDNRNFIELLNNQRRATTLNNLLGNDISNILENSDNIQEDFSNLIENFGKDLGIDIKVNYTDTKGMPLESKDKGGTARLDGTNGEIYINTDRIKNTSEFVGTVFEELSHIIDGVAGRQDKEVAETTDEKGLESLGRPVNDYFVETYKEDSKEISLVSDKKDYTNAGGVNVGDFDPISAGTVYISTLLSSSDLELDLMSLADSGSELVANPSLGTGAVFAIDLIGTALPGVQATVIRRGGEVLLKAVDGTVYKVVGKSADEILKIIGDTSVGKTTVKLADDVLEKLSSAINKVDSKIDDALGLTIKNADSSATKIGKNSIIPTNEIKQNSVYPNFDFEHVIGGDVNKSGKKVMGGHSLNRGDVRISKIIDEPDINGVYNAEVEIFNPKTQKWEIKKSNTTMFPNNWNEERIKEEIKSAWESKNFTLTEDIYGKSWTGTSKSGVEIKGFINKDKTTAFPLYKERIR